MTTIFRRVSLSAAILFVATTARGDVIPTWSGASASVQVFDKTNSQSGSSASASSTTSQSVGYYGSYINTPPLTFSVPVNGSATAEATGQADDLLRLNATYQAPNPGTATFFESFVATLPVQAAATWSDDRVTVSSPAGGSLPASIRLEFTGGFSVDRDSMSNLGLAKTQGYVVFGANGQSVAFDRDNAGGSFQTYTPSPGTLSLDSFTSPNIQDYESGHLR